MGSYTRTISFGGFDGTSDSLTRDPFPVGGISCLEGLLLEISYLLGRSRSYDTAVNTSCSHETFSLFLDLTRGSIEKQGV